MRIAKFVSAAVALGFVLACGGSGGYSTPPVNNAPTVPPTDNGVLVLNNSFSPASRSVTAGTTITWTWATCSGGDGYTGQTCVAHDIVFDDGSNSASGIQDSGSFSRTFATRGTYNYHCSVHGAAVMSGTVTVN
jgi:plastocyanin